VVVRAVVADWAVVVVAMEVGVVAAVATAQREAATAAVGTWNDS
jgi:hypothetical protein